VDHLDEAITRLRSEGVRIVAPARTAANGRINYAFIEGPDHISIELVEGQAVKK
jgi:catechol 2,3-dioxygenase-like lactoylglutathione lyase family enzyme